MFVWIGESSENSVMSSSPWGPHGGGSPSDLSGAM